MSLPVVNLLSDCTTSPYDTTHTYDHPTSEHSYWCKGTRKDENTITIMQHWVGCKDYILDTQFRAPSGIKLSKWNKKQIRENCIILWTGTQKHTDNLVYWVTTFLHPLETKLGLSLTKINLVEKMINHNGIPETLRTYKGTCVVVEGDQKWNSSGFVWSMYLSVIRCMLWQEKTEEIKTMFDFIRLAENTNEKALYTNAKAADYDTFIKWAFSNIENFFIPVEKEFDPYHGHLKNGTMGHGICGPFYVGAITKKVIQIFKWYKKAGIKLDKIQCIPTNMWAKMYMEGMLNVR